MASNEFFQVGDVITLNNVPQIPPDMKWRVDAIVPWKGIRLRPHGTTATDRFNDAAGEFWITGPDDKPFDE